MQGISPQLYGSTSPQGNAQMEALRKEIKSLKQAQEKQNEVDRIIGDLKDKHSQIIAGLRDKINELQLKNRRDKAFPRISSLLPSLQQTPAPTQPPAAALAPSVSLSQSNDKQPEPALEVAGTPQQQRVQIEEPEAEAAQPQQPVQQQQQQAQSPVKEEILVSPCKRYLAGFFMWEDGYIALSKYYLGYGKGNGNTGKQKAIYRAKEGQHEKKEFFDYYYAYPVQHCEAKLYSPANIDSFSMMVTYSPLSLSPPEHSNHREQIFAFEKLEDRDAFIAHINDYSRIHKAELAVVKSKNSDEKKTSEGDIANNTDTPAPQAPQAPQAAPVAPADAPLVAPTSSSSMTPEKQQEAKDLLQKYLDNTEHYRGIFEHLYQYKNLSSSIKAVMTNELFLKFSESYTATKQELEKLISRLDNTDSSVRLPTSADITNAIRAVRELLSKADILKKKIIGAILSLPDGYGDNAVLIDTAREMVKKIKEDDEAYKEMSVYSTTTDMATLLKEAETVKNKVAVLDSSVDSLKDFYKSDGTVDSDMLGEAKQKVVELKQLVERIDAAFTSAQKILEKVSIFDSAAHRDAESSVNKIEKIKIEIYIAAAKSLAILVTNMAKSAETAADAAIAAGKKVIDADTREKKEATTFTREDFDKLTAAFENAFKAYDSITIEDVDLNFQIYLNMATNMVSSFKGDKIELTANLQIAMKQDELFKIQKKSADKKNTEMGNLNDEMGELKKYLSGVDAEFGKIDEFDRLSKEALAKLKENKNVGMADFKKYDELMSSSSSATDITAAKKAADLAFDEVKKLNDEIIRCCSEAKGIADHVIRDAKFLFIKKEAEEKLKPEPTIESNRKEAVDELEDKRNVSYKISSINELQAKSGDLVPLLKAIKKSESDIGLIKKEIDAKNSAVASKIDTQANASNITDITADIKVSVDAGAGLVIKATKLNSEAAVSLQVIKELAHDIKKLYEEMKDGNSVGFNTYATMLVSMLEKNAESLEEAKGVSGRIDTAFDDATATQKGTEEMAKLYAEIYVKYTGALELVTTFELDKKIGAQTDLMTSTGKTVERNVASASAAYGTIMKFAEDRVLDVEEMSTIQKNYSQMELDKTGILKALHDFSAKNDEFDALVKKDLLDELTAALSFVNDKMVLPYISVNGYAKKVSSQLTALLEQNHEKVKKSETNSYALVEKIAKGIKGVSRFMDDAKARIGLLTILHEKDTCNFNGNRLKFSTNKLSGKKPTYINFSDGNREATYINILDECPWLCTDSGIPTECPDSVRWKIQISNTKGGNLPDLIMGIGLESFTPPTEISEGCVPTNGFWGVSGTDMFNDGKKTKDSHDNIFKSEDYVNFTLSPATYVPPDKNKFQL